MPKRCKNCDCTSVWASLFDDEHPQRSQHRREVHGADRGLDCPSVTGCALPCAIAVAARSEGPGCFVCGEPVGLARAFGVACRALGAVGLDGHARVFGHGPEHGPLGLALGPAAAQHRCARQLAARRAHWPDQLAKRWFAGTGPRHPAGAGLVTVVASGLARAKHSNTKSARAGPTPPQARHTPDRVAPAPALATGLAGGPIDLARQHGGDAVRCAGPVRL